LNAISNKIKSDLNIFADWIVEYVPRAVKENVSNIIAKVNNIIFHTIYKNIYFRKLKPKRIFEVQEALKRTVKQYTIDGVYGYGPMSFLDQVRPTVIDLLTENHQVKVYFVLSCIMECVDMKSVAVISL